MLLWEVLFNLWLNTSPKCMDKECWWPEASYTYPLFCEIHINFFLFCQGEGGKTFPDRNVKIGSLLFMFWELNCRQVCLDFLMQTKTTKQINAATCCLQLIKFEIVICKILSKQNFMTCLVDKGKVVDLVCLVNGVICSWLPVKSGVPQGSVLWPADDLSDGIEHIHAGWC